VGKFPHDRSHGPTSGPLQADRELHMIPVAETVASQMHTSQEVNNKSKVCVTCTKTNLATTTEKKNHLRTWTWNGRMGVIAM
jgi:hypothetical protein